MQSIKKIVIIGPESTGKSSLAASLAEYYQTVWVPEYAREYLLNLSRNYQQKDLYEIAEGQMEAENNALEQANRFLFCDTDLYVIKVWSEHKYNACDYRVLQEIAVRNYDLYLLTDIDIPWIYDPLREHPEPEMRKYFQQVYLDIVQHTGRPWLSLKGSPEVCLQEAVRFIYSELEPEKEL